MSKKYKVERKPAGPNVKYYEVMLSPFNTKQEVQQYIEKYQCYYPKEDRNYRITELNVSQ
jgi:hypothetical protein